MKVKHYCAGLFLLMLSIGTQANVLNIAVEIADIQAEPYHRPYVAIWLETPKRKPIHTFAFWREQEEWFKDLRQWWRKVGRKQSSAYDGVTGATRKPGLYRFSWDGTLSNGEHIAAGHYVLHIEAVREQGSREYLKQAITIGSQQNQHYVLSGKTELGNITITMEQK